MRIGLVQYNPEWENKSVNQEKIQNLINSVSTKIDLLIFPEMTLTGYTMNTKLGEPFNLNESQTLQFFSQLSLQCEVISVGGFIEKENDKIFNTLFVVDKSGKIISRYRKIHLFSFAEEEKYYESGNEPVVVEVDSIKIGLSICYDLRFPELFRFYAKEKVELIINIANWPESRIDHYVHLLKARAIENQCFMVGVNRVGYVKKDYYNGRSSIFDPMGNEIVSLVNEEKLIVAEIDFQKVREVRNKFPFLNDIKLI